MAGSIKKIAASLRTCGNCDANEDPPDTTLSACSRCQLVYYCSRACQAQHWKQKPAGHKQFCVTLEERRPPAPQHEEVFPKSSADIGFCVIWDCISSSSSSTWVLNRTVREARQQSRAQTTSAPFASSCSPLLVSFLPCHVPMCFTSLVPQLSRIDH